MAPTVTPPPYPGPFGSGPHPVLGEPSGAFPALRPNDGRGNMSGAHRAVGEGSATRRLVSVEPLQQPATRRDVVDELTDSQGFDKFRQDHPFDDRLYAIVERVAYALVGSPVESARKEIRGLVKLVLDSEAYVPPAPLRVLDQVAGSVTVGVEGRGAVAAVEKFRNAAEVVLRAWRKG